MCVKRLLAFRVVCSPEWCDDDDDDDDDGVACDDAAMRAMRAFFFSTMLCIYFSDAVCVCVSMSMSMSMSRGCRHCTTRAV